LLPLGVRFALEEEPRIEPEAYGISSALLRPLLLEAASVDLQRGWDPSVHVMETVRAAEELEEMTNRIAERLESWAERPEPEAPAEGSGAPSVPSSPAPAESRPPDPELLQGRAGLTQLLEQVTRTNRELYRALEAALPRMAPNLCSLLGPRLAARMVSQAGGLDRLARMPASTVQVLGAEKSFFEHLRGRAPPPRHGLLFLHPSLHSAPRAQRGRMARALAGKVAIAARMDRAGAAVRPELRAAFDQRVAAIRAQPKNSRPRARRPLRAPLHRTA
ncbi:MAG: hypothetical protein L3K11_08935, partial [Thermoplasmata archaeon]|nr:hypothetical protein [Thermoplasmata archaeon]